MFPPEAFRTLLVQLSDLLQCKHIRFALTGGLVSAFYTEPRLTQDIDILVDREGLSPVLDSVTAEWQVAGYLFDKSEVHRAVHAGRPFQLFHTAECLRLDVYPRELVEGEIGRAVRAELYSGVMLPIVCKSDLVISKLLWIQRGSHKSRRDVRQLMRNLDPPETERVRQLARERSLDPVLDEVLSEPDEIEE
ncbi:MAG TPA: hypothetical protein VM510_09670 [Caulifigura sp.]|jgi:hypothetical protein|nr:hypothetical protein [Caulifigura sp.]